MPLWEQSELRGWGGFGVGGGGVEEVVEKEYLRTRKAKKKEA